MTRAAMAIVGLGLIAALAGCSPDDGADDEFAQYGQRILTVTPGAGDDQAANLAIQTKTPWPRHAFNKRIPGNGKLMVKAVKDYESGKRPQEPGGSLSGGTSGGAGGGISGGVGATP